MVRRGRGTAHVRSRGRRGGRRTLVARTLAALALLPLAGRLPAYGRLIVDLLADDRVPRARKAVLAVAAGYTILPTDLVAERVPVLGLLDDLVIDALAVELFFAGVPVDVLDERLAGVGLSRLEFDEDRARIRRTVPVMLRRVASRLPEVGAEAMRLANSIHAGPRLRAWLTKEGSPA